MNGQGKSRILVLEEANPGPSTSISHLFENMPEVFHVCSVADREEALKLIYTFQPHVVMADLLYPVLSPELDGGWLCHEVRRLQSANPIIILTSDLNRPEQQERVTAKARSLGADAFLPRPLIQAVAVATILDQMAERINSGAKSCYASDVLRAASNT